MTDVTIPADVAKRYAAALRGEFQPDWPHDMSRDALADILDPPTPTLREQVAQAIVRTYRTGSPEGIDYIDADAVLAVVADWLAAQPLAPIPAVTIEQQRDHDVRLLRGES